MAPAPARAFTGAGVDRRRRTVDKRRMAKLYFYYASMNAGKSTVLSAVELQLS